MGKSFIYDKTTIFLNWLQVLHAVHIQYSAQDLGHNQLCCFTNILMAIHKQPENRSKIQEVHKIEVPQIVITKWHIQEKVSMTSLCSQQLLELFMETVLKFSYK